MEKSEILQQWIEAAIPDPFLFQQRRAVYTHLLGTAHFAAMLAMKRGADSEAAELAGLLHDISTYLTGNGEDHARKGAGAGLANSGRSAVGHASAAGTDRIGCSAPQRQGTHPDAA